MAWEPGVIRVATGMPRMAEGSSTEVAGSAQVLDAFTGFFDTTDADTADVMLQAAYAAMVRHVAERYAGEPWVLGYDKNLYQRDFYTFVDIDTDALAKAHVNKKP